MIGTRNSFLPAVYIGFAAAAIAAIGFFAFSPGGWYQRYSTAANLPSDFSHASFLSSDGNMYASNGVQFFSSNPGGMRIADFSREGDTAAYLGVDADSKNMAVIIDGTVLERGGMKRDIALSPDGTKVAYAEAKILGGEFGSIPRNHPDGWNVVLLTVATKETEVLGTGYSPLFADASHLVRFTSEGIIARNLVSGEESQVFSFPFGDVRIPIVQSPDNRFFAWRDHLTNTIRIFGIATIDPLTFQPVAAFESPALFYSLGNSAFYTFETTPEGTRFSKRTLEYPEPEFLHLIPSGFGTILKMEL